MYVSIAWLSACARVEAECPAREGSGVVCQLGIRPANAPYHRARAARCDSPTTRRRLSRRAATPCLRARCRRSRATSARSGCAAATRSSTRGCGRHNRSVQRRACTLGLHCGAPSPTRTHAHNTTTKPGACVWPRRSGGQGVCVSPGHDDDRKRAGARPAARQRQGALLYNSHDSTGAPPPRTPHNSKHVRSPARWRATSCRSWSVVHARGWTRCARTAW